MSHQSKHSSDMRTTRQDVPSRSSTLWSDFIDLITFILKLYEQHAIIRFSVSVSQEVIDAKMHDFRNTNWASLRNEPSLSHFRRNPPSHRMEDFSGADRKSVV